jgi:thiol-disulfide isomerase/thioredoxin
MRITQTIVIFILLLVIFGCNSKIENKSDKNKSVEIKKSRTIREEILFTLETIDGKTLHVREIDNGLEFQELKGHPIYLVLFGYRCPPCLREIPELVELTKEYKNLEIVAIEVQGLDSDALQEFVSDRGINYAVISGYGNMDFINYIQLKAQWSGAIPFLLGLNRQGQVKIMQVGGISKSELQLGYKELINP